MRHANKGFTLVEVIIVMTIIAMLSAVVGPSMGGFIDRGRDADMIADTRYSLVAAQTCLTEAYGNSTTKILSVDYSEVKELAEVEGSVLFISYTPLAQVEHLVYAKSNRYCTYCLNKGADNCGVTQTFTVDNTVDTRLMLSIAQPAINYLSPTKLNDILGPLKNTTVTIEGKLTKIANPFTESIDSSPDPAKAAGRTLAIMAYLRENEPTVASFFTSVTWKLYNTGSTSDNKGLILYFADRNYGVNNAENVRIYEYNLDTGTYRYTDTGFVRDNGTIWGKNTTGKPMFNEAARKWQSIDMEDIVIHSGE